MANTAATILRESVKTPKHLYKYLMRECNKLPGDAQKFYKHSIRQSFKQHVIEPDPERVKQIMEKALYDAEWVLKKYKINNDPLETSKT
ncbi:LYR motif-containing protein 9 isoform X2 [Venturia canescens]|uniref:LYR motif-containing protein 9 isoform X2 n=1 Tax=Venturia canescens TaxID=32260 RepID=UPI001C9C670E|nr:LYR motif-containing protein 9 isoform X2 [Venturia canescens]